MTIEGWPELAAPTAPRLCSPFLGLNVSNKLI
jgi:hypothetical protein